LSAGLEVVPQLTRLQHLSLLEPNDCTSKLMQLTQLKQLTHLYYGHTWTRPRAELEVNLKLTGLH
jgi:hypothetical protein